MLCSLARDIWFLHTDSMHRSDKKVSIVLGDFPHSLAGLARSFLQFVFSLVCVTYEMSDIGHVHDMLYVISEKCQYAADTIIHRIFPQMPKVCDVIYSRSTAVHSDSLSTAKWCKFLDRSGKGVINAHGVIIGKRNIRGGGKFVSW